MTALIRIQEEIFTNEQFVNYLKFSNEFQALMEGFIEKRIILREAKEKGISLTETEIQQASDDFRRCMGLHRVSDTQKWLDENGLTLNEFEVFIKEFLLSGKMMTTIINKENMENYFRQHAPRFDTVDICRIVIRGENKARELMLLLCEEPEKFAAFAKKYSLDEETRDIGGYVRGLCRDMMNEDMEARLFHAEEGEIMGPFHISNSDIYEIIRIAARKPATMEDAAVREKVAESLRKEWVEKHRENLIIEGGSSWKN